MLFVYPHFPSVLARYLTNRGRYPTNVDLRTPAGRVSVTLFSYHDLLTLNEVFASQDYPASTGLRTVIDLGSNIGISALYFLTRNHSARVYCFEPVHLNCERLKKTVAPFLQRVVLREVAVATLEGRFDFVMEPTGRYGGLQHGFGYNRDASHVTQVQCLEINSVLDEIFACEEFVDILKIDTEGPEIATVEAIRSDLLPKIGRIDIEASCDSPLRHSELIQWQDGSICRFKPRRR